jgi:hypothetical protein
LPACMHMISFFIAWAFHYRPPRIARLYVNPHSARGSIWHFFHCPTRLPMSSLIFLNALSVSKHATNQALLLTDADALINPMAQVYYRCHLLR